jgi:hypothetical protein
VPETYPQGPPHTAVLGTSKPGAVSLFAQLRLHQPKHVSTSWASTTLCQRTASPWSHLVTNWLSCGSGPPALPGPGCRITATASVCTCIHHSVTPICLPGVCVVSCTSCCLAKRLARVHTTIGDNTINNSCAGQQQVPLHTKLSSYATLRTKLDQHEWKHHSRPAKHPSAPLTHHATDWPTATCEHTTTTQVCVVSWLNCSRGVRYTLLLCAMHVCCGPCCGCHGDGLPA